MKQELALAEQKAMNEQQTKLAQKDQEIAQLQSQIQNFDTEKSWPRKKLNRQVIRLLLAKDKELQALENQLATFVWSMKINCKRPFRLRKRAWSGQNQLLLQEKRKRVVLLLLSKITKPSQGSQWTSRILQEFQNKQSTKAIGESLEQYAESEFNKVP